MPFIHIFFESWHCNKSSPQDLAFAHTLLGCQLVSRVAISPKKCFSLLKNVIGCLFITEFLVFKPRVSRVFRWTWVGFEKFQTLKPETGPYARVRPSHSLNH